MPVISIDKQSFIWLKRKVDKQAKAYSKLPENEAKKEERMVKHWQTMNKKFKDLDNTMKGDGPFELQLQRIELKSLHAEALATMVYLVDKIIPEYSARMEKSDDKREFYQEYLDRAQALYEGLAVLCSEITKAINRNPGPLNR